MGIKKGNCRDLLDGFIKYDFLSLPEPPTLSYLNGSSRLANVNWLDALCIIVMVKDIDRKKKRNLKRYF